MVINAMCRCRHGPDAPGTVVSAVVVAVVAVVLVIVDGAVSRLVWSWSWCKSSLCVCRYLAGRMISEIEGRPDSGAMPFMEFDFTRHTRDQDDRREIEINGGRGSRTCS